MAGQLSVNLLPYNLTEIEREAADRCATARSYEEAEDFAKARESLGVFYAADASLLQHLSEPLCAEVLFRTGSLLRRVADRQRLGDDLERAKNYLFEALQLFRKLGIKEKIAESLSALAAAYWSAGDYVRCRHLLNEPVFDEVASAPIKAYRLYLLGIVTRCEKMYPEAVSLFRQAVSVCNEISNPAITCKYLGGLGNALLLLGEQEGSVAYINEALFYYTLSSQQAEESGNSRHAGFVINNLGFIFFRHKRYGEAHEQLERARAIFERLQDFSCIAQVNETRAQVLNAEGRYKEAIPLLRKSIQTFEITGENIHQAEALLTLHAALMGSGQVDEAGRAAERAAELFALNEMVDGEGRAQLARAEVLASQPKFQPGKLLRSFIRAARLLAANNDAAVMQRLDGIEKKLLEVSDESQACQPVDNSKTHKAVMNGALWDEGLTLEEAKARVEEWYLARLILECGTLEAIAQELDLTAEGVRQKIARYPHLDTLRRAMRDSNVVPLNARRRSRSLIRIRLREDDNHLAAEGPGGGDSLGVERCECLAADELGVVKIKGVMFAGYFDAAAGTPTLHSGHKDYPSIPCKSSEVEIVGRVVGYWQKGKGRQRMKEIRTS